MLGYLKTDRPGVLEPPPDGWHDTGDIVTIDAQGFVTIKGRAKRFAKVGGEMISLAAVEALAGDLWPQHQSAVVAAPDARKGERLILATQKKDATRSEFMTFAKQQHAADLMIPSEVMVFDALPMLGSGKVDLITLAKLVAERTAAKPEVARVQA
jgi:acyl-[acyl-carrier-protein]-phospholipid O-acyltransferase/long-chain-fatty-acid--[acyl-carrier-protein] ligase